MIRYCIDAEDWIFIKSFAKNMNKDVGKNISSNLSGKYSQTLLNHAKQSVADTHKTASK